MRGIEKGIGAGRAEARRGVSAGIVAFVLLAIAVTPFLAQPAAAPVTTWAKVLGGYERAWGVDVLPTPDGGYAVLGEILPIDGNSQAWVLKMTATGAIEWQYFYGGPGGERPERIRPTSDGGYVVAGYTTSSDFGAILRDAWIVKLDALGGIQWQMRHGGTGNDRAVDIQQTSDGGFIVAGLSNSHRGGGWEGGEDAWILKLDSAGGTVWQKAYGGSGSQCATSIQQTADGGYIVAGSKEVSGLPRAWLFKLTSAGAISWQKIYGYVSGGGQLCPSAYMRNNPDVLITADGGYLVNPVYFYGGEPTDGYAMKVDSRGKVLWRKAYGTASSEWFRTAEAMPDGGFLLAGLWRDGGVDRPWVVRTDSAGNLLWQKTYGMSTGNADGQAARATADGGVFLVGNWHWGPGSYDYSMIAMKLDGDGNPGVCTDPTIGVDSNAVQRTSGVKSLGNQAKVGTPSTTASATTATPVPSNAVESQLCSG